MHKTKQRVQTVAEGESGWNALWAVGDRGKRRSNPARPSSAIQKGIAQYFDPVNTFLDTTSALKAALRLLNDQERRRSH